MLVEGTRDKSMYISPSERIRRTEVKSTIFYKRSLLWRGKWCKTILTGYRMQLIRRMWCGRVGKIQYNKRASFERPKPKLYPNLSLLLLKYQSKPKPQPVPQLTKKKRENSVAKRTERDPSQRWVFRCFALTCFHSLLYFLYSSTLYFNSNVPAA